MAVTVSEILHTLAIWLCWIPYLTQATPSRKFTLPGRDCNQYLSHMSGAEVTGRGLYSYTGRCEIQLSTGSTTDRWTFHVADMSLMSCYVSVLLYDKYDIGNTTLPLYEFRCASPDPGIVPLNSSFVRLVLLHHNKTNFRFQITFTARNTQSGCHGGYMCPNTYCISRDLLCDGTNNCFDQTDELPNTTAYCINYDPFPGENFAVLGSVVGGSICMGIMAFCCRMIRNKRQLDIIEDELDDLANGPYVKKYAYMYAVIKPQNRQQRNKRRKSKINQRPDHSVDEPEF